MPERATLKAGREVSRGRSSQPERALKAGGRRAERRGERNRYESERRQAPETRAIGAAAGGEDFGPFPWEINAERGSSLEPPLLWPVVAEAPAIPTHHTKPPPDEPSYRDSNSTV